MPRLRIAVRRSSGSFSVFASSISRADVSADEHRLDDPLLDLDRRSPSDRAARARRARPSRPSCWTASPRRSTFCSLCAAVSRRSFAPPTMKARRIRRLTSTSVGAGHRFPPATSEALAATRLPEVVDRPALELRVSNCPRAMPLSTSRAFGELLCASTNSARDFSFGAAVPSSSFWRIGIAWSASESSSALIAIELQVLVGSRCRGRTGWPLSRRTSCFELLRLGRDSGSSDSPA